MDTIINDNTPYITHDTLRFYQHGPGKTCSTVLYNILIGLIDPYKNAQNLIILSCIAPNCTELIYKILNCTALYCTVLHYNALHHTELLCSAQSNCNACKETVPQWLNWGDFTEGNITETAKWRGWGVECSQCALCTVWC